MSGEIEAAGAAATAGLAAAAIERPEAHQAGAGAACANCGAVITGRYCAQCGQPAHVHHSLWHLLEEALHGLFHFDSKVWRTLPSLALRPGTLTREYIDGKRARYVSPLALFLFCIFAMFAVFAFTADSGSGEPGALVSPSPSSQAEGLRRVRADVEAEEAKARARGDETEARAQATAKAALDAVARSGAKSVPGTGGAVVTVRRESLTRELQAAQREGKLQINLGNARLNAAARHAVENPDLALYKIQQAAYKFAFLLIPISLPLIALLFLWKRRFTWFDHTVFALYSLSFMSIFFMLGSLALSLTRGLAPVRDLIETAIMLVPPVHMFFQLGGAYQLGWFSALWRTLALIAICGAALLLFFVLVVLIGVLG